MKRTELPSVSEPPKPQKRKRKKTYKSDSVVTAEVPVKKVYHGYATESVFLRRLTVNQKRGLSLMFQGVSGADKRLANNRVVKHPVDAMRWLLEQISDSVPE